MEQIVEFFPETTELIVIQSDSFPIEKNRIKRYSLTQME